MEYVSLVVSVGALLISGATLWLTQLRRGRVSMTRPTVIFFGHDSGARASPKVFLRALLYSTGKVGHVVEHLYVRLRRRETNQNFNIWVYGEERLARGSGLFVGPEGVAANHHFLLPSDDTAFEFKAGDYHLEIFARLVGYNQSRLLQSVDLVLPLEVSDYLKREAAGAYFDWGPDSQSYHIHLEDRPNPTPDVLKSLLQPLEEHGTRR